MTQVLPGIRAFVEKHIGKAPFKVGDRVKHPDGRTVEITGGQYWGTYGLSNFWYWRPINEDGTVGDEESGYGWEPENG